MQYSNTHETESLFEGFLTKSRRGIRLAPIKSKWARRYFVLKKESSHSGQTSTVLEEFTFEDRKKLRKTIDMSKCIKIESHLKVDDAAKCTIVMSTFRFVFALHFERNEAKNKPIYFAAATSELMHEWVERLRLAAQLELVDQEDQIRPEEIHDLRSELASRRAPSSAVSVSSGMDSFHEDLSDVTSDGATNRRHFKKLRSQLTTTRAGNLGTGQQYDMERGRQGFRIGSRNDFFSRKQRSGSGEGRSSPSICSTHTSSQRSSDDEDGMPYANAASRRFGTANRERNGSSKIAMTKKQMSVQLSMQTESSPHNSVSIDSREQWDQDHGVRQADSQDTLIFRDGQMWIGAEEYENVSSVSDSPLRSEPHNPPPVDRSNKPANLRLQTSHDEETMSLTSQRSRSRPRDHVPTRYRNVMNHTMNRSYHEPPKSAGPLSSRGELNYVVTGPEQALSNTGGRSFNDEYVKIDPERTQAVKLANRRTAD